MTLVNTDYSFAPLWRSRIVGDSLLVPLGFDSLPGHKIYKSGSPLTRSIDCQYTLCVYFYTCMQYQTIKLYWASLYCIVYRDFAISLQFSGWNQKH